jgi:hypothetical protein
MSEDHDKYLLRVTAGPDYDDSTHQIVPVNALEAVEIENEHVTVRLNVRIQGYKGNAPNEPQSRYFPGFPRPTHASRHTDPATGLPHDSPSTSAYFSDPAHTHDQYSIAFSFIPKNTISGDDLVFGNDLDRPIRDRLPPGFSKALKIATWFIDPGLEGDPYADKPYLYGPALSSLNVVRIGEKVSENTGNNEGWKLPVTANEDVIREGGDGEGETIRTEKNIPIEAEKRKKWFLDQTHRRDFEFEEGRVYQADFFNPYVVFNGMWHTSLPNQLPCLTLNPDFSVKLPGFSVSVLKYVDEKSHELRYVLKNKTTGDILFVVLFTLLFREPRTPSYGSRSSSRKSIRNGARKSSRAGSVASSRKGSAIRSESQQRAEPTVNGAFVPHDDDVD